MKISEWVCGFVSSSTTVSKPGPFLHHFLGSRTVWFFFFLFPLFFSRKNLLRKFWPQSTLSFPFDKRGNDRERLRKLCMNRSADREATRRTNSENYSLCKSCLMYSLLLPHRLLCFPLFPLPCFRCCLHNKTLHRRQRTQKKLFL